MLCTSKRCGQDKGHCHHKSPHKKSYDKGTLEKQNAFSQKKKGGTEQWKTEAVQLYPGSCGRYHLSYIPTYVLSEHQWLTPPKHNGRVFMARHRTRREKPKQERLPRRAAESRLPSISCVAFFCQKGHPIEACMVMLSNLLQVCVWADTAIETNDTFRIERAAPTRKKVMENRKETFILVCQEEEEEEEG
jgi:hypothetical protein